MLPSFAEVKVLQQQNMLNVHHMHTWVCTLFKRNYEQHLYTHTLIPIINRFASTNEPLSILYKNKKNVILTFKSQYFALHIAKDWYVAKRDEIYNIFSEQ